MKKIIALLLVFNIILSGFGILAFAKSNPSVTVGTTSGKKGDCIYVPVVLSGNSGFANLGIEIGYDGEALKLMEVRENTGVGATFTQAPSTDINPFNMTWDCISNNEFNGTLVILTFQIISDKADTYPVTVNYYKGRNGDYRDGNNVNYDENFSPLGLSYVSGNISINEDRENRIVIHSDGLVELVGQNFDGKIVLVSYKDGKIAYVQFFDAVSQSVYLSDDSAYDYTEVMWWANNLAPKCKPVFWTY